MSGYAVLKGAGYTLSVAPDMLLHSGTTQTTERMLKPESDYLRELPDHLRSYDDVLNYMPNQIYIGNRSPEELRTMELPWFEKPIAGMREGKYGEIMPQDEFIGLMKICDVFDLVKLEENFGLAVQQKLISHPLIGAEKASCLSSNLVNTQEIQQLINEDGAEPLYHSGELVGAIKRAHEYDQTLSAHIMLENLASKASSVLSLLHLINNTSIDPSEVDYVIDCSEEACGDINQRGGGNFAKAAAEIADMRNATGSDIRSFCAGPVHAILNAASLVKAGTFKTVVVTAGGSTAKLGMNGKDHVKKGMPVLEDAIAGFAVLITANDGVNPIIRTDIVGRHKVGTGSSPQAVISSLVTEPLDSANLSIKDVDKFAPELQNPDITKPAGAGDVPEANYKMIAALGIKRGEIDRADMDQFLIKHGLVGWAPTQGHIPSGVPILGYLREELLAGKMKRGMIIGKGSLFLGRMTNLFDGVSFIVEANDGSTAEDVQIDERNIKRMIGEAMKSFAEGLCAE